MGGDTPYLLLNIIEQYRASVNMEWYWVETLTNSPVGGWQRAKVHGVAQSALWGKTGVEFKIEAIWGYTTNFELVDFVGPKVL